MGADRWGGARRAARGALSQDLFSQQARNRARSRWVVAGFVLFFAWLGLGGDLVAYLASRGAEPGAYRHLFPVFGVVLTLLAAGVAWHAWLAGAQQVLWSTGARELVEPDGPREQQLVNVVDEMSIASGVARPRLWIVPDDDPNAFATGMTATTSHLAVTSGLLALLTRDELQGVIGHELGHIRNLDVRLMTLLAALVGAVALMGDGVWRVMRSGSRGGLARPAARQSGGRGRRSEGAGALVIVLLALWVLSWLLAPLITRLLAMSVSRQREFLADAMSAQFTRNPAALASALEKLEQASAPTRAIKRGSAHLCIADPTGAARRVNAWFATHPPISTRVARLRAMSYAPPADVDAVTKTRDATDV